jgi:hypothetical protein
MSESEKSQPACRHSRLTQAEGLVNLLHREGHGVAIVFSFFAWRLTGCVAVQQHRLAQGSASCPLVHQATAETCSWPSAKSKA